MKNAMIASVLKEYRKKNSLSVKDVALALSKKSLTVAEKTIYGWENGQSQPDADTLLILCEIYHIDDILGTFGYTPNARINLTEIETNVILNLRKHPEMLPAVKKLLDV